MQYFNSGISWQLSIVCMDTSIVSVVLLYFTVERVQKVLSSENTSIVTDVTRIVHYWCLRKTVWKL